MPAPRFAMRLPALAICQRGRGGESAVAAVFDARASYRTDHDTYHTAYDTRLMPHDTCHMKHGTRITPHTHTDNRSHP